MVRQEPFLRVPSPLPDPEVYLKGPQGHLLPELALQASEAGGALILPGVDAAAFGPGSPLRQLKGGVVFPDHRIRAALAGLALASRGDDPEIIAPLFVDRGMEALPQALLRALLLEGRLDEADAYLRAIVALEAPVAQAIALGPLLACRALVACTSLPQDAAPSSLWQPPIDALLRAWTPDTPLPLWRAGALALGGLTQVPGAMGESVTRLLLGFGKELRRAINAGLPLAPETTLRWSLLQEILRGLFLGVERDEPLLSQLETLLGDHALFARTLCDGVIDDGARGDGLRRWLMNSQEGLPLALRPRVREALQCLSIAPTEKEGEGEGGAPELKLEGSIPELLQACQALWEGGQEEEAEALLLRVAGKLAQGGGEALAMAEHLRGPSSSLGELTLIAIEEGAQARFFAEDRDPWLREVGGAEFRALAQALLELGELEGELEVLRAGALGWLARGESAFIAPLLGCLDRVQGEDLGGCLRALGASQVLVRESLMHLTRALEAETSSLRLAGAEGLGYMARGWDPDSRLLEGWPQLPEVLLRSANVGDIPMAYMTMRALWALIRQRVGEE